jgi:hypothetical protein
MNYEIPNQFQSAIPQIQMPLLPQKPLATQKVYGRVKGKLAQWDVVTDSIAEAIQTVTDVEQIKPVLVLVK